MVLIKYLKKTPNSQEKFLETELKKSKEELIEELVELREQNIRYEFEIECLKADIETLKKNIIDIEIESENPSFFYETL